jgi:hypothetical protein
VRGMGSECDDDNHTAYIRLKTLGTPNSPRQDIAHSASPAVILYTPLRQLETLAPSPLPLQFHPASGDLDSRPTVPSHGAEAKQASPALASGIRLVRGLAAHHS